MLWFLFLLILAHQEYTSPQKSSHFLMGRYLPVISNPHILLSIHECIHSFIQQILFYQLLCTRQWESPVRSRREVSPCFEHVLLSSHLRGHDFYYSAQSLIWKAYLRYLLYKIVHLGTSLL